MKFSDYYSEKECLYLFDLNKYKFRKLNPTGMIKIGGLGITLYPVDNLMELADEHGFLLDPEFMTRLRRVDVDRRLRDFNVEEYIPVNEILKYIPRSRQRISQVAKSRTSRFRIFNVYFYNKELFKKWTLNEGRLVEIKADESYKMLGFSEFDKWLKVVQTW